MQPVSAEFTNAQEADVNKPISKVQLVLGNYFNKTLYDGTVTATSVDSPTVYPVSGVNDGDRTEINIGSASSADNDIGLSSWRSSQRPSTTAQSLTFSLSSSQIINRIKLYHLSTNPIKTWKLEAYVGGSYTQVCATSDLGGAGTLFSTTAELDVVDFSSTASNSWKLTISKMQALNAYADVVEVEAYRLVDITDRCKSVRVGRQRDYKMANPMAAIASIDLDNSDQYFALFHPAYVLTQDIITSSTTWSADTDGGDITVECIGGGAGGGKPPGSFKGGGGGEYRKTEGISYDSGTDISVTVGTGGAGATSSGNGADGTQSVWGSSVVIAKPGLGNGTGGTGGTGTVGNDGGAGGAGAVEGGNGGGGAGGPNGDGAAGGTASALSGGGSGGGGNGGGSIGLDPGLSGVPGLGGDNYSGVGGGNNSADGYDGGGGGGGQGAATGFAGGDGSTGLDFDATHGSGGGGGGGGGVQVGTGGTVGAAGGNGGLYGAGGGGGGYGSGIQGNGGNGANGLVVVTYYKQVSTLAADSIADELVPNIGLIIQQGFEFPSTGEELVNEFVGYVDRISVRPKTREVTIEARDGMKILLNRKDSTKLKTSIDIGDAIKYVLNRCNISSYETSIDSTSIVIDYFFTDKQSSLDTIRNLTQAAVDALFYFDEDGIAKFRYYVSSVNQSHLYTLQGDWESGTLTNLSTLASVAGQIQTPVRHSPAISAGTISGNGYETGGTLKITQVNPDESYAPNWGAGSLIDNTGAAFHALRVAQPFDPARLGSCTVYSITFQAGYYTLGNSTFTVGIWSDSGGTPNAALWTSGTLTCTQQYGYYTHNTFTEYPSLAVTNGNRYWLVFTSTDSKQSVIPTDGGLSFAGLGQANAKSYYNSAWNDSGVLTHRFGYVVTGVAQTVTWTGPTYDTLSSAIGSTAYIKAASLSLPGSSTCTIYIDRSDDASSWTNDFSKSASTSEQSNAASNHRYWRIRISLYTPDDHATTPYVGAISLDWGQTGEWVSDSLDMGGSVISLGVIGATVYTPTGTSIEYWTATSADDITYDSYVLATGNQILSDVARYIKIKAILTMTTGRNLTPIIYDLTANWTSGGGSAKYPAASNFTASYNSTLLDIEDEISDSISGDSAIWNNVSVQAQPSVLTGSSSDTVWQGTVGTPPLSISGSAPLTVTNGTPIVLTPYISGGMDITNMSGANPAALVVTFAGGGAGSWVATTINPTFPVFTITITGTGTITDLRIIGKRFSQATYIQGQNVKSAISIARNGDRAQSISNIWILSAATALSIAQSLVDNYKHPIGYLPSILIRPNFAVQLGDRCTIIDTSIDLSGDFMVIGVDQEFSTSQGGGVCQTQLKVIKIPASF